MEDSLTHHIALGFATSYLLEWLKRAQWFPWVNQHSDLLNRLISVAAAFFSSVGIQAVMTGNLSFETGATITLTLPSLSVITDTLVHTLGQLAIQQATYQGLIQKPKPTLSLNTSTGEASINVPAPRP